MTGMRLLRDLATLLIILQRSEGALPKNSTDMRGLLRKFTNSHHAVVVTISTMIILGLAGKLTLASWRRFIPMNWHHSFMVPKFDMDQNII